NYDVYAFEDALGMAEAYGNAQILETKLINTRPISLTREVERENNVNVAGEVKKNMPLLMRISEPAMGIALAIRLAIPLLMAPVIVNPSNISVIKKSLGKRIDYLKGIMGATSRLAGYTDPSCEQVVSELKNAGLFELEAALKCGKIATGAVTVASAMVGVLGVLNDIYENCGKDRITWKIGADFVSYARKAKEAIIRKAVSAVLVPIGYDISIIDAFMQMNFDMDLTQEELKDMMQRGKDALKEQV
ncbi:MAG: hypothetical protein Q8M92_05365, partial [Candidatus Subteraquimicrobiales bacterium]|nr:hypothetical protein [Candidatus Subteraquimicrobiales bacterium]